MSPAEPQRLALLRSQRESAPGSVPGNRALCKAWPGTSAHPLLYNSKYCPAIVDPSHYWYYAVGWAIVAMVVGFYFFWRAEAKYGRG